MPLIAGALYSQNEAVSGVVERLLAATKKRIVADQVSYKSTGMALMVGKEETESAAELIHAFNDDPSTIIAGRVFSKNMVPYDTVGLSLEKIQQTNGRWLGENYWGRYILVSFDKEKKAVTLYRDPQGIATLFYMRYKGAILFSTHCDLLYDAVDEKPELNWDYLTSFVVNAHNVTTSTPFVGIEELHPGSVTQLRADGSCSIEQFWDPTAIASRFVENEDAYLDCLYDTFLACTKAWTQGADKICVELSGGLDSSSVLAVLKDVLPHEKDVVAVNMFHPAIASSNERDFAQQVADATDTPLKFADWSTHLPFAPVNIERRLNKPTTFILDSEFNNEMLNYAQLGPQGEFMCGQGGDHLFLAPPFVESPADYFLEKGVSGIFSKISEMSAYHRMPHWRVMSKSLNALVQYWRGTLDYIPLSLNFQPWMTDSFKSQVRADIFKPLFWEGLKKLSPGKAQHTFAVYQATLYIDRGYRIPGKPVLNPLLSQPLVEQALSMPTYQTSADGYNRVHFRRAMAKHKKGNYIWRKSKGETSGIVVLGMRAHFDAVCKLLLDGQFSKKGFIDREKLHEKLIAFKHGKTDSLWPLINLIVAEVWLNSWGLNTNSFDKTC